MKIEETQIKTSWEYLTNMLNQVEDRISGLEDKVEQLEHSYKFKEKVIRTCKTS
jgi:hypothetical protein